MRGAGSNCSPLPGPRAPGGQTATRDLLSARAGGEAAPVFCSRRPAQGEGSLWTSNLEYCLHFTKDLQAGEAGEGKPLQLEARLPYRCGGEEEPPLREGSGPGARQPPVSGGERRNKGHSSTNSEFACKCQSHCLFLQASTSARGYDQDVLAWRVSSRPAMPAPVAPISLPAASGDFGGP